MSAELKELLALVFASQAAAEAWMRAPVAMLGGRTPASLMDEGRGDEVVAVLSGVASGAHA